MGRVVALAGDQQLDVIGELGERIDQEVEVLLRVDAAEEADSKRLALAARTRLWHRRARLHGRVVDDADPFGLRRRQRVIGLELRGEDEEGRPALIEPLQGQLLALACAAARVLDVEAGERLVRGDDDRRLSHPPRGQPAEQAEPPGAMDVYEVEVTRAAGDPRRLAGAEAPAVGRLGRPAEGPERLDLDPGGAQRLGEAARALQRLGGAGGGDDVLDPGPLGGKQHVGRPRLGAAASRVEARDHREDPHAEASARPARSPCSRIHSAVRATPSSSPTGSRGAIARIGSRS